MHLLVADIGGTNGRFGMASVDERTGIITLQQVRTYLNEDFSDLGGLLKQYLSTLDDDVPGSACLAVAGPTDGFTGFMVNLDWEIDAYNLEQVSAITRIQLVNDFAAQAAAVLRLGATDIVCLHEGTAGAGGIAVIGPGTGLGVAALTPGMNRKVLSGEGGHMSWAPVDERERALHSYLRDRVDYLCVESLLSGAGLVRIYEFLNQDGPQSPIPLGPAHITDRALGDTDATCTDCVQMFLAILGSVAGDLVLAQGATAGLYLGGGILPRIEPLIAQSALLDRFQSKGPLSPYMENIPVNLITAENTTLTGAAALYCYG
jgi:glucokinase